MLQSRLKSDFILHLGRISIEMYMALLALIGNLPCLLRWLFFRKSVSVQRVPYNAATLVLYLHSAPLKNAQIVYFFSLPSSSFCSQSTPRFFSSLRNNLLRVGLSTLLNIQPEGPVATLCFATIVLRKERILCDDHIDVITVFSSGAVGVN